MSIQDFKKVSQQKFASENKGAKLLHAQERNKKNVCRLSNKKLWDSHLEEKNAGGSGSENRDHLIRKYAYLVSWVVGRLPVTSLQGMDRDDLIGYGTIGLIEAVDRFDPKRNASFESFAITRIKGSIYDQLRASDWLTRGSRKKVKNLFKATSNLEAKLGRYPNNKELAEELSVSPQELRAIQQEAQIGIFSLDEPRDNFSEESPTVIDSVSSNSASVLDELEENELKECLTKAIEALPEKEKTVVGLYHYKKLTFKEIAEIMDFSESRASQIHARAITLLKSKMLKE
ncbi:MAG: FliA/WhiG family RNA polymerase sigma factor [Candidatus Melainabacteria bacterium]|nr:FliA/WhiG family RNA polymerase sigma factor [Candidatus Melainabacteria bacterium]